MTHLHTYKNKKSGKYCFRILSGTKMLGFLYFFSFVAKWNSCRDSRVQKRPAFTYCRCCRTNSWRAFITWSWNCWWSWLIIGCRCGTLRRRFGWNTYACCCLFDLWSTTGSDFISFFYKNHRSRHFVVFYSLQYNEM